MAALAEPVFSIHDFLAQERGKDLLRFSTAGSVDDGKSTLIGRLLYDTQSVYEDQVRSIEGKGTTAPGQIDFALLTDGLRAEREQGITIDVAYRYFSTGKRKFIIADTPGHEQYTRNMATGASTADATVVLIDASKGVLIQSRRHAYIASLLRVRHVLVAVNKMDLIGYDQAAFLAIERDFNALLAEIAGDTGNPVEARFVPVSALKGDNIVHRSQAMAWYQGPSLLELLEQLPPSQASSQQQNAAFRFPVQRVVRPDHTFRGFSGQIASGTVRVGDAVTALPSGRSAVVERIVTWDGDLAEAQAPLSVTLVLDQELDISRGDLIAAADAPAAVTRSITAALVWMDAKPLDRAKRYLLKHTSHTVPTFVTSVDHRTDIATFQHVPAQTLEMNGIGVVTLSLLRPMAVDRYSDHRGTGAFILIDPESNSTVAAGMVRAVGEEESSIAFVDGPVSAAERTSRWGHAGRVLSLQGPAAGIDRVERVLFESGAVTVRLHLQQPNAEALREAYVEAGLLVLEIEERENLALRAAGRELVLDGGDATKAVLDLLAQVGVLTHTRKVANG
ncbi:MAG TPA: sulfate adenylyltransferase subunit CysN [Acidobacteriaceae bacterium]|nr:sulfate adenylyltransferase subunit CysN [Acidobacteriaceae bacterium]